MRTVVDVEHVYMNFQDEEVLHDVTFSFQEGKIYGIVGNNGSGKTVLMKCICGFLRPTRGRIFVNYKEIGHDVDFPEDIGIIIETPGFLPNLTGYKNLEILASLRGKAGKERIRESIKMTGLDPDLKKHVVKYSLGMRQRLGIAIALAGDPDFLVLDEPANGLDPQGIIEMRELILKLNRERQITVLISSHILDELSRLATHYGFIDRGHMIKEISAQELEAACRKCVRVEVTDTGVLSKVLDRMELEYEILSDSQADIFASVNVTALVLALAEMNCEVLSMSIRDESLESYYVSLVGGGSYE